VSLQPVSLLSPGFTCLFHVSPSPSHRVCSIVQSLLLLICLLCPLYLSADQLNILNCQDQHSGNRYTTNIDTSHARYPSPLSHIYSSFPFFACILLIIGLSPHIFMSPFAHSTFLSLDHYLPHIYPHCLLFLHHICFPVPTIHFFSFRLF